MKISRIPLIFLGTLALSLWFAGCSPTGDDDDATISATPPMSGDSDADGYTVEDGDCNDDDPAINPGADERCDGVDNDCDGDVDENDAVDATGWYKDIDGDGYGSDMQPVMACDAPEGHVDNGDDCNDDDPAINPGAQEVCDAGRVDEDCNGLADDDDPNVDPTTQTTFYPDADLDGDGDADAQGELRCYGPQGYSESHGDCDDQDSSRNSLANEVCDGADVDENCNGLADDDDPETTDDSKTTFYSDMDEDGFGALDTDPILACNKTNQLSRTNDDCDDTNAAINPDAQEVCDDANTDENCNGLADDEDPQTLQTTKSTFYVDADGDGFGSNLDDGVLACDSSDGQAANDRDCNDDNPDINPAASEVCDDLGTDENCNGLANDNDPTTTATSRTVYYHDVDMDAYGNANDSRLFCADPSTGTDWWTDTDNTDCNDRNADIHPDATETCNEIDDDCDGTVDEDASDAQTWYRDSDLDGYGTVDDTTQACTRPAGYVSRGGDCDDGNVAVNPDAQEVCDANDVDEDCDGTADDDDADTDSDTKTRYYVDADHDGYGDETSSGVLYCDPPNGYVLDHTDCNDSSGLYNPGVEETDCADPNDYNCDGSVGATDADGDGFFACEECDDTDPLVNPAAVEVCDPSDVDENCNGLADDDDPDVAPSSQTTYYTDADGDGYGDTADTGEASCEPIEDRVTTHDDCNDDDPAINPGAPEVCDPSDVDENCNGLADDDDPSINTASMTAYYHDVDQDGYGATTNPSFHCEDPTTSLDWWTSDHSDCNDRNEAVHPGADEVCNGVDDNCDGTVDDASAIDATTWYLDQDDDGYGTPVTKTTACTRPGGYVSNDSDCDDTNPAVNPEASEVCDPDGVDENCNGLANDDDPSTDSATQARYYPDADGDGYGDDTSEGTLACAPPDGFVADHTDCNDNDVAYNPGVVEDDCTDPNDYNCDGSTGYVDGDGDGYPACTDCDDDDPAINPGVTERCDDADIDENCNGLADDDDSDVDPTTRKRYYVDADGDGFGDASGSGVLRCDAEQGYTADHTDCDDTRSDVNPEAAEVCDDRNTDENCNGVADNDDDTTAQATMTTYYHDVDTDGFGDPDNTAVYCDDPSTSTDWWTQDGTDCDDRDAAINPGQAEVCNAVDDDCDGDADESDAIDAVTYFADVDGDGYGNDAVKVDACKPPSGYVAESGDCDDTDPAVNPGALEVCDPLDRDENCNGLVDDDDPTTKEGTQTWYYVDADGDGYGRDTDTGTRFCDPPAGYSALPGDCDDTDPAFNPGALEDDCADPNDYNCDGVVGYDDADGDGFAACEECDDQNAAVNPAASEVCNGIDDDCDGLIDDADDSLEGSSLTAYYTDADGDGYGDDGTGALYCDNPTTADLAWTTTPGDCDDSTSAVNPAAEEVCNEIDDDCDGLVDGWTATDAQLYYGDADQDGYGDPFAAIRDCAQPEGTVINHDDCNDTDPETNPAATEDCQDLGVDQNCNHLYGCDDPDCAPLDACANTEVCDNGMDDNGNGLTDCDDPACGLHPSCTVAPCPDAQIAGTYGTVFVSTTGAGDDLRGSCGGDGAEDLAFSWTAPETGTFTFDTDGSSFDTVLYAFDGDCSGPEIACNDDREIQGTTPLSAQFSLNLEAGQTVVLVVDGYGTSAGDVTLTIAPVETDCLDTVDNDGDGLADCNDPDCAEASACNLEVCDDGIDNDGNGLIDCTDDACSSDPSCQEVSCPDTDAGSTLPLNLAGFTNEGSNYYAGTCGGATGPDYAISWTAPQDGAYTISTEGSEFDTVLYLFADDCSSGLELACNDDVDLTGGNTASAITQWLAAGETIIVVVDGFGEADFGYFYLTIVASEAGNCEDGADNDGDGWSDCLDPDCATDSACVVEDCGNGVDDDGDGLADCVDDDCAAEPACQSLSCPDLDAGTAVGAPIAYGSTVGVSNDFASTLCGGKGGTASDVTIAWTAPEDGDYLIDTLGSSFDTVLYLLSGTCDGPEIACNDDVDGLPQSLIALTATAGETFIIVVDGYDTAEGDIVLNVRYAESQFCADGSDNDGDGLTDCDDPDCAGNTACLTETCDNHIDDDLDGYIDCLDPDCTGSSACENFSCPDLDLGEALGYAVATGTTSGAGNDMAGTCDGSTYGDAAEEIAYAWTAPWEGHFTFTTEDSAFDTVMYVFADTCSGEPFGCNDDGPSGSPAQLDIYLSAGQTIVVVIDGYGTESGEYVLSIYPHETYFCTDGLDNDGDGLVDCDDEDCAGTSDCVPEVCDDGIDNDSDGLIDCLDDECSASSACSGFVCPEIDLGSLVGDGLATGSTDDSSDTFHLSCGTGTSPDMAARWTAPEDGYYRIDTFGSDFDTVLAVLDGDCTGPELACNDQGMDGTSNQSEITEWFNAGQVVTIVVDGWSGDSGAFVVNISPAAEPTPTPEPVLDTSCVDEDLGSAVGTGLAAGSTAQADHTFDDLCYGEQAGDVAFAWESPASGTYTFQLTGTDFTPTLTIYRNDLGDTCPGSTLYACDYQADSSTPITTDLMLGPGETLTIVISGLDTGWGDYTLDILQSESGFCDDAIDNDGDGAMDCDDPDCADDIACLSEDCADGVDNDQDYAVDCRDPDCAGVDGCGTEPCIDEDLDSGLGDLLFSTTIGGSGDDYQDLCEGETGEDIAFAWTAPEDGNYILSTQGSDFPVSLTIFQPNPNAASCLGDSLWCETQDDPSGYITVSISAAAGQQLAFVIDDYTGTGGVLSLSIVEDTTVDVVFEVEVPATTPDTDIVYLSGSAVELGEWAPDAIPMTNLGGNLWSTTVTFARDTYFEYKYTRGTWDTVETDASGADIANRVGIADYDQTVSDVVARWADSSGSVAVDHLVINEVDYDQPGTDVDEFVEIYNPSGTTIDLSDFELVLVNGGYTPPSDYDRISLADAGTLDPGGYLVVASTTVVVDSGAPVIYFGSPDGNLQNGGSLPDGLAIMRVSTGEVIDALSYEGELQDAVIDGNPVDLVEGQATTAEDSGAGSLIRYPNGTDTDNATADWVFTTTLTPGKANRYTTN